VNVHASKLEYASATGYDDRTTRINNDNYYSADMNKGKERSRERITSDSVTAHEAASRVYLKNELFHGEINK
jgi:hypothetical protein